MPLHDRNEQVLQLSTDLVDIRILTYWILTRIGSSACSPSDYMNSAVTWSLNAN
ncbi:hypothetical protein [Haladaptatus sp. CMAA 1911]|uniref:hypothetical protein n=1 Tax=unclassified Haladaptatus TaxID=2622732 RepID=UPI003754CB9E